MFIRRDGIVRYILLARRLVSGSEFGCEIALHFVDLGLSSWVPSAES
jgi:hypothetical protein